MQLVVPDILADVRSLSPGLVGLGLLAGIFLWLFGWRSHRFWLVMLTTVLAGVYGLYEAPTFKANPLLGALLLSLSAGLLALALIRVLAFLAGGMSGLWFIQIAAPHVDQPLVVFLVSGLLSLFLFRLWMMALTSTVGTVLVFYCGLSLLEQAGTIDAVSWTSQGEMLLNWLSGFFVFLGLTFQFTMDRKSRSSSHDDEDEDEDPTIWTRAFGWTGVFRKAG